MDYNFIKSIFSQPGVDGGVYHGDKIAERLRGEKSPQVDRHGNFNGKKPPMPTMFLLLEQGIEQDGVQIFRDGGIVFGSYRHDLLYRHDAVNNI